MPIMTEEALLDAVVLIIDEAGGDSFGTGFPIHRDGDDIWLLTCAHVLTDVEEAGTPGARFNDGWKPVDIVARGDKKTTGIDLAVLKVSGLPIPQILPLNPLGKQGRTCRIPGFTEAGDIKKLGKALTAELGQPLADLSYQQRVNRWGLIITDDRSAIAGGYSGSPIICDITGTIVAVTSHEDAHERAGDSGYAIDIKHLREIWPEMPETLFRRDSTNFPTRRLNFNLPHAAYCIDFEPQEIAFHNAVNSHLGDPTKRTRPLLCFVPGHHLNGTIAAGLMDRLIDNLQKGCPGTVQNPKQAFDRGINNVNKTPWYAKTAETSDQIAERIKFILGVTDLEEVQSHPFGRPTVFHMTFDMNFKESIEQWLQEFLQFWAAWPNQHELLMVCIFLSYLPESHNPLKFWLYRHRFYNQRVETALRQHLGATANINSFMLPPLGFISLDEAKVFLKNFDDDQKSQHVRVGLGKLFKQHKAEQVKDELPLKTLCEGLETMLWLDKNLNPEHP